MAKSLLELGQTPGQVICLVFKRGCMRVSPLGGTGPSPILTIFTPGIGINPKPGHEVLFRQVISKNVRKTERKVYFWPILEKRVWPKMPIMAKMFLKWPDMVPGYLRS